MTGSSQDRSLDPLAAVTAYSATAPNSDPVPSPDLYLDPEFRKENDRRATLFGGSPFGGSSDPWPTVKDNPLSPRYLRDYGGTPGAPAK